MDRPGLIESPADHPHADAIALANIELRSGIEAAAEGNLGRARVCARRAVGSFLQAIARTLPGDVGTHAMANLRYVQEAGHLPGEQRDAADRLARGPRAQPAEGMISEDPLADATLIINYFLRQASDTQSRGDDASR